MRGSIVFVLGLTVLLVVSACGADSKTVVQTTPTTAPVPSSPAAQARAKDKFISQADAICTRARVSFKSADKELRKFPRPLATHMTAVCSRLTKRPPCKPSRDRTTSSPPITCIG